jgi:hypothetical protein
MTPPLANRRAVIVAEDGYPAVVVGWRSVGFCDNFDLLLE